MLDQLELKWRSLVNCCTPAECVGGAQFFAWDEDPDGEGVVICIGSNYSQYPTTSHASTKTGLRTWRANYRHAVNQINSGWDREWREHAWLAGNTPPDKPRFFIMSNLVPWITSRSWTLLSEVTTRGIVDCFDQRFCKGHLVDLQAMFPAAFVVGHGINDRTFPYLHAAIDLWDDRMIWANLSFPKTPSVWDPARQRFKF